MTIKSTDHHRHYKNETTFYDFLDSQNGMTVKSLSMFSSSMTVIYGFHSNFTNQAEHERIHNESFTMNINLSPISSLTNEF